MIANCAASFYLARLNNSLFIDNHRRGIAGAIAGYAALGRQQGVGASTFVQLGAHKHTGQQALLYRLNGDLNPVHADPDIAAAAGFARPILHGLCSYGIAGCALLRTVCNHDETRMGALSVRFSAPAFPGDTIRTRIWREDGRALFTCHALERDVQIITNGIMEFAR